MNRALGAATVGVLLLSPLALSACSAGQVTQTATQERDKVGAMAQVGNITVRAAEFEHPRGGAYEEGDDAELRMAIVNSGQEPDTLVGIEGEGFGDVEIETETETETGEATASPGAADGTTTAPATGGNGSAELEIPADSIVFVDGESATITLTDLEEGLTVGQYIELTLLFENAGEVTLPVTVANPDEEVERGEAFDFHQEEGHGEEGHAEEGAEDAARERESRRQESGGE